MTSKCPGSGRRPQPGMGRQICPVCHVTVSKKRHPRVDVVPEHEPRQR